MGLKLVGSFTSSPSALITGTRIDLFCETGRSPSQRERLQSTVRNGRRVSTSSWRMNVGTGSRLQVFGADARIVSRNSSLVTGLKMDKPQFVGGKVGGGQPAVASR